MQMRWEMKVIEHMETWYTYHIAGHDDGGEGKAMELEASGTRR